MSKWTIVIITGASRGFGRACAVAFAAGLTHNSAMKHVQFIVHGQDPKELAITADEISRIRQNLPQDATRIRIVRSDLTKASSLDDVAKDLFDNLVSEDEKVDEISFINNAGSLGPLAPIGSELHDISTFIDVIHANITSSCYLTSSLIKRLNDAQFLKECNKCNIIQVSSLAAVQAFSSWGIYCAGKAARDMYHKTLAEEQKVSPASGRDSIKVLSYAPGPMDTNMQKQIREGEKVDQSMKDIFIGMKERNELVDPNQSANRLFHLVDKGTFESGSHIDFYDLSD